MVEVIVFAEGQSEEQFIKRVVAPTLRSIQIYLKPQTLRTSQDSKGGAVNFDRLKFNARNALRQNPSAILTTFVDLYGLDTSFPSYGEAKTKADVYSRVTCLEAGLHDAIVSHVNCRRERFIPHIQPYEFEALLFSDVAALCRAEPSWNLYEKKLAQIRSDVDSPEHINDGYETKPSKRLENILHPEYKKTRHGPLAAEQITLAVMETQCTHFGEWMNKLRALAEN
jgi:Domain of unknown function (DUF4276)